MQALEKTLALKTHVLVQTLLFIDYLALDNLFKPLVFERRHRYPWGISDEEKNTKILAYLYSANFPQRFDAGCGERAFTKVG